MSLEDSRELVKALLKRRSQTLAEDLGIDMVSNDAEDLFCLLIASLLLSARIGHLLAMRSARILFDRGWTSARKMAATTWAQRVKALDEGGYARYDERTSTMLGFFREAQIAWPELYPFADAKILETAKQVGLPADAAKLAALVPRKRDFVRLVNALMDVRLNREQDEIRALAA